MAVCSSNLSITLLSITILLSISKSISPQHISTVDSPESDCTGRWIHIRDLPSTFNVDLLQTCSSYHPLLKDFCPFLANHGLGPKTNNRSNSWYRTDPIMLELIFHRRMIEYPCLTPDPFKADAIYLPYYGGLDSLRYLYGADVNSSREHGLELYRFLTTDSPEIWSRRSSHDHFLVLARTAWDFSQPLDNDPPIWGTSLLELTQFFNITALVHESRTWPWQEQAIPYPTSFHPSTLPFFDQWIRRVRRSRRTTLMLFAGGGGTSLMPNIRRSIRIECDNATVDNNEIMAVIADPSSSFTKMCEFVDCSDGVCEYDPIRFMKPMLQSTFCLQPPGDTPTRRSTFDGILAGCIPVFFEDQSARFQYGFHFPANEFDEFSVSISKEDVVFKGVRIVDVLMSIPKSEVRRLREKVMEYIPRIMYKHHGSSVGLINKKDAFDIAIDGVLNKIHDRVQNLAQYY